MLDRSTAANVHGRGSGRSPPRRGVPRPSAALIAPLTLPSIQGPAHPYQQESLGWKFGLRPPYCVSAVDHNSFCQFLLFTAQPSRGSALMMIFTIITLQTCKLRRELNSNKLSSSNASHLGKPT